MINLVPQELLCRSSLETQKLELMAEVSSLKLKLAGMEKERLEFDERFGDSEVRNTPTVHSESREREITRASPLLYKKSLADL